MNTKNFVAIDLGATSGRTILGIIRNDSIELREINRFPNKIIEANGHFYWDFLNLYQSILEGLKLISEEGIEPVSIGIDTWGVDFACFDQYGELLGNPYSYRDPHTTGAPERFFTKMSREKLYASTGIQIMNFNSVFQLDTLRENDSTVLKQADKILFMPDALSYMLTGNAVTEYTIASTAQMLDARTRNFDPEILRLLGVKAGQFGKFVMPGTVVGNLSDSVQRQTGLGAVPVIAVAGHDTASAVASVPTQSHRFAYLSSGTWSLMGIETLEPILTEKSSSLNFTNEGGIEGTIRFLKNICGMWLLEKSRTEWGVNAEDNSYPQLIADARQSAGFVSFINPDDPVFANPTSMVKAIQDYCEASGQEVPRTKAEIARCIFDSLAMRYRQVFDYLKEFAGYPVEQLHVIGGGSKNSLLNQFTANALGVNVVAGPTEATAIGNIVIQAKSAGLYTSIDAMRESISNSVDLKTYVPEDTALWNEQYQLYLKVTSR
ncbi:MAG: rhamnulokinase [Paludibacter sp. 47-17]|nr:MAG: rhamnulokinase [Paludibacter sp. 47-17]